ncbi:hypothetical protein B7463_g3398, partial [Scytalidium lignicola]
MAAAKPGTQKHDSSTSGHTSLPVGPPDNRSLELGGKDHRGSDTRTTKRKQGRRVIGGAKRVEPDASQDLTPAPEAKDYWTWDDERRQFYHVNPQTEEREYYLSGSEGE